MYMQDTLLRCITISLLPVGDEFGGPCFCPPLFLRSADALESNCRARTRIGIGREVEFTRIDAPSAIRTAIRRKLSFGKLVLSGRTVSGKPRRAGERNSCSFRSGQNRVSTEPESSQARNRNSPHTEKLHGPLENQFKDFCERIRQCSKFFAFSGLHKGAAISICPSRFADASIGRLGSESEWRVLAATERPCARVFRGRTNGQRGTSLPTGLQGGASRHCRTSAVRLAMQAWVSARAAK